MNRALLLSLLLLTVVDQRASATPANREFSSATKLVQDLFTSLPKQEALQKLKIIKVELTSGPNLAVSYHVIIRDRRDPNHPATNDMRATAVFVEKSGQWRLTSVKNLEQTLAFATTVGDAEKLR